MLAKAAAPNAECQAILASTLLPSVLANAASPAILAVGPHLHMLTNFAAPALLAVPPLHFVLANAEAPNAECPALLASVPHLSMHAWTTSHKFAITWKTAVRTIMIFASSFMLYALGLRHKL